MIVPVDKASNNFGIVCKKFYLAVIQKELGISYNGDSYIYYYFLPRFTVSCMKLVIFLITISYAKYFVHSYTVDVVFTLSYMNMCALFVCLCLDLVIIGILRISIIDLY